MSPAGQAYCTSVVDVNTHSNIPAHDFTTRSETKEESKQTDGAAVPKTAQPAKRLASSSSRVKASDEESPTIVTPTITTRQSGSSITEDTLTTIMRSGGAGQEFYSNPDEATSSADESAKELEASPSHDQSQGLRPQKHELLTTEGRLGIPNVTRNPMEAQASYEGRGVSDQAGKSVHSAQVESSVSACISGQDQDDAPRECTSDSPPATGMDNQKTRYPVGTGAPQTTGERIAAGKEAASAQAVKRGHQVQVEEIPDDEDDTSFLLSQKTNKNLPIAHEETQSMVAKFSDSGVKTEKVPHEWLKPFEAEWTLRRIKEAKTESEARAILLNWIHKTRVEEVVDNLLEGLRKAMRTNALEQMDELRKPRRYICRLSGNEKSLTTNIQIEGSTGRNHIKTSALIDSGCTSSAINRAFVKKHDLPTRATAAPITVYNADGSKNSSGQITAFAELRITIGDHAERIDLAVTDLHDQDIFLGHDWLARHNPLINWQTGKMIFGRCQCRHTPIPLPDADPYDKWDEELEEGDTILAISFEEAIHIRASRHVANDLAAEANAGKKTKTFEEMVPEWCRDFKDLFDKESFDELPEPKPWDHAIELIPNANANLDCKVYPLNRAEQEELDNFLDENLSSGRICPSKSPMASPFFFVKKKDGKLRPVQDYRKLNEMTIKNRYPLPLISELMDKLRGAKYFSKLDVRWGYNNVRIKTGDEWKAAFRTNRGLYEPTVMFFGLTNSPATFQWMMNDIFKDLIASGKVTIYLDDILIMSKTKEEHRQITRRVLATLRKHKLFLKAEKCEFEVLETEYLGVIISEGSIRMDPVKIKGILDWPVPTKKKELQSFLGFTNFYRRFIKNYSKIVKPMTQLTRNDAWKWGRAQQEAFEQLKKQLAEDVVLAIPTNEGKFRVEADASEGAIGAVLSQEQEGKWRPVSFLSKSLSVTERNYEIYDKELLAIMLALEEWRHYLMGAYQDFEIWTDHQNLQYFRKPQKVNRRQARWITELAEYHFTLHHKAGTANKKADLLLR